MIRHVLAAAFAGSLTLAPAFAEEEFTPKHYDPLPSETLEEAVENFNSHNAMVAEILEKDELTADDMERVHELTYTIEVALAKIVEELETLPVALETLHLASEGDNPDELRGVAEVYLEQAMTLQ